MSCGGELSRRQYGRLAAQLALIFVAIAVGSVIATIAVVAVTAAADAHKILSREEAAQATAAAQGAGVTFRPVGWQQALRPVFVIAERSGEAIQVRDRAGRVVRSSPGFAGFPPGAAGRAPVRARGRLVGSVTVKFGDHGVGTVLALFQAQLWRARLIATGVVVLFAVIVAALVGPLVAGPVDRLITVARSRGAGRRRARAGPVRGFRDMRDLAVSFDQMCDAVDGQEQIRRNLMAYLAHELRTPAAVLQATTEAMLDGVIEPAARQLESLHDEAVRLSQMIVRLLRLASAVAAVGGLAPEPEDLAAVAAAAADSLAEIFRAAGVGLSRRLESVIVLADQDPMRDVITNLLTNAAKFTPSGGQALLETGPAGDQAILRVSDTGIGIPAEELPMVTQRFYRGRNVGTVVGSGLGLAICDELIQAHHGTMTLTSGPAQGTQVTIRLPRAY